MEVESLKIITEAGAMGIVVLLVIYSAWKDKMHNKSRNNHEAHTHDAVIEMTAVIKNNTKAIEGVTQIMERVERKLDK